jgi:serine/threonine protein kinase
MADIYLARRAGIGDFARHVAVKVLSPTRAVDDEVRAMFLDEARVCAMLNHQNIAAVLEVDVVDGHHYLAMEYVHGADLRELVAAAARTATCIPFESSLAIVAAAAAGLDHAHRRCGPDGQPLRLVHRDVSLSNIMVGHDGSVKVVDFGIASTAVQTVHTSPGVVRGKASYMSPEQCLGDPVDHRTDVFALGIVLYELTTGTRCFHGKTDFDRMLAVVRGSYAAPSEIVHDYPLELDQVVRTALALDPAMRYPSAAALIEALERVAKGRGWAAGTGAVARLMRDVFGIVDEPWAMPATVCAPGEPTERQTPSARRQTLPSTSSTPRSDRLARGSIAEIHGTDDDDAPTRGRRPIPRRPSSPRAVA